MMSQGLLPARLTPTFFPRSSRRSVIFSRVTQTYGTKVVPATDGDNLRSLRITREQTRGGAHGCMNISGNQRLISSRRAVDSDGLDDQALFLKESLITGHEQRKRDRRKQWDRNAHLLLCRHRSRSEYDNYSEYYRAKQRRDLHPSCPSLLRPAPGKRSRSGRQVIVPSFASKKAR